MSHRIAKSLLLAVVLVTLPQTLAQVPVPPVSEVSAAQAAEYSVVGDVQAPNTYQFPHANRQIRVTDLLQRAGSEPRGVVAIFRNSPRQPITRETFDARFPERSTFLHPGDFVVFRSESRLVPAVQNALIVFSNGTAHLPLQTGARSVIELLTQLRAESSMSVVVCRTSVPQIEQLILRGSQAVQHGDVVDLRHLTLNADLTTRPVDMPALVPPADNLVVNPVSESQEIETEEPAPVPDETQTAMVSLAEASREVLTESLPQSEPAVANIGKPEKEARAGTSPVMNTVFIAGLLFAVGLILVGWVRTSQDELQAQVEERTLEGIHEASEAAARVAVLSEEPVNKNAVADLHREEHHQFTWVNDDSPVLTAGIEPPPATAPEVPSKQPASVLASWFDEAAQTKVIETALQPAAELSATSEPVMDHPESPSPVEGVSVSAGVDWQELDDLIHNRLPVEVQPAALPMRVTLFGRPSGPIHLRVDAAHEEIAPPHMLSRGKRTSKRRHVESVSATGSAPEQQVMSDELDLSRLDKALNFLEERSDS